MDGLEKIDPGASWRGQLLGETSQGERSDLTLRHDVKVLSHHDRHDFRILARAFGEDAKISADEWHQKIKIA